MISKCSNKGKNLTLEERNLKITLAYDGSAFFGFQLQPLVPTVQGFLEKSLALILGEKVQVIGSGRTDTGVHAYGQVASVKIRSPIPVDKLKLALNRSLPSAIHIRSVEEVDSEFNARFSVKSKLYRYLFHEVDEFSPFLERFFCQQLGKLDLKRMQIGATKFVGEHDFSAFTKSPARLESTVRRILATKVGRKKKIIFFDVEGTGFLHNMVRNMAKALLLIGSHQMEPDEIMELYRNQDRRRLGEPAPPGGLYLMRVLY